jgi:glycosyltransferase involved in cell wall biosynthesis
MRIAVFHELDLGGAKRAVVEYAKRLKKDNIVDLYYVNDCRDINLEKFCSNNYWYKFNPKIWRGNDWTTKLYKDTFELVKLYKLHKKIALDIKSKKYDYIFVHPSKFTQAPFLLRFLSNKCIYYCQEPLRMVYDPVISSDLKNILFPKNLYESLARSMRKGIDMKNFNSAKIILANSNYSRRFIEKSYGKKAQVCYLGVDADVFVPLNQNKVIDVLFIGNKDIGYNFLDKLSEIFKNKINIKAIFRGNGKPNITDTELVNVYNKSKVLVALNHNEPFGLIPLEAMASGIPVIAVNEGGYKESVVDGKTGFLIRREGSDLYEKVKKILSNDKMRKDMGIAARENILKNWTWEKSVGRFLQIIKYEK